MLHFIRPRGWTAHHESKKFQEKTIELTQLRFLPFHFKNKVRPVGQVKGDIAQGLIHREEKMP